MSFNLEPFFIPLWIFYIIISAFTAGIIVFAYYWFYLRWRNRISATIYRGDKPAKNFRLKLGVEKFDYSNKTYTVPTDLSKFKKSKRGAPIVTYDLDKIEPLMYEVDYSGKRNPEGLHIILKNHALSQLLSRAQIKMLFMVFVLGLIGIAVTAVVGFYFVNQANSQTNQLFREFMNITSGGKLK